MPRGRDKAPSQIKVCASRRTCAQWARALRLAHALGMSGNRLQAESIGRTMIYLRERYPDWRERLAAHEAKTAKRRKPTKESMPPRESIEPHVSRIDG